MNEKVSMNLQFSFCVYLYIILYVDSFGNYVALETDRNSWFIGFLCKFATYIYEEADINLL